jgi:hypothetical protein
MYRANYALLPILEHLGPAADSLDVSWADCAGDRSSTLEFTVPVDGQAERHESPLVHAGDRRSPESCRCRPLGKKILPAERQ